MSFISANSWNIAIWAVILKKEAPMTFIVHILFLIICIPHPQTENSLQFELLFQLPSGFRLLWRTSSLLTSFFFIAFCAAAFVATRKPSAASRSRCCWSSFSGLAAAPWQHKCAKRHSSQTQPIITIASRGQRASFSPCVNTAQMTEWGI